MSQMRLSRHLLLLYLQPSSHYDCCICGLCICLDAVPGRDWLFVIVVSLMVVPTQLAFLPILQGFSGIASWATALNAWMTDCEATKSCEVASKSFASLWVTHTAFGLPAGDLSATELYCGPTTGAVGKCAIDGANHLQIFVKLIVPLSVPALASFSIFQFLWVWNDLIVALYIGPNNSDDLVFLYVFSNSWAHLKTSFIF